MVSSTDTQTTKNNTVSNNSTIHTQVCIAKHRQTIYKTKQQQIRKVEYYKSIHTYIHTYIPSENQTATTKT